jgi:hypothetical protein
VPPTRPALRPRWCSSEYTSPILQAASAALLGCIPPIQRWCQSAAKPLPCCCGGQAVAEASRRSGSFSIFVPPHRGFAVGAPSPFARQGDRWLPVAQRGFASQPPVKHAAKPLPCCRRLKRRRLAGAVASDAAKMVQRSTNLLPVAFKPGRRLRPLHLPSARDLPARTETAPRAPPLHDSNKIRKPLRQQRQHPAPLPQYTTPVRTGAAHAPTCSRTRFSRPSGRTSGSGVQRHGSPVVQRAFAEVWLIAYGCGRHSRASRLEIVERTPRELSRAFNVHGQIS